MRVAILTSWYPTIKDPTYGIFVRTQAKGLSEFVDIDVILIERGLVPKTSTEQDQNLTVHKKSCFYFPNINESFLKKWAHQYYLHFKSIHEKKKYDIIHCHDHYGAYAGWYINQKMGIPYVVTIHNSNILDLTLVEWKQNYLSKILSKASEIISVGKDLAETLQNKFTSGPITILPNYVNTEIFKPSAKDIGDRPFQFIFIGDFNENKGVINLIRAFARLISKNSNLLLIGKGPLEKEVHSEINKLGISDKVKIHQEISNDELPSYYNESHAYISLSKKETFGITILEAMSCGLPIIYTKSGGPEQLVLEDASILTSKTDINLIAQSMDEMIALYPQIDKLKIRKHVLDHFSPEAVLNKLMNIYKSYTDE